MYRYEEDDDRPLPTASGSYKIPDRDFYRKNFSTFSSVYNHFQQKLEVRSFKDRRWDQPHYSSLIQVRTPYSNLINPADGICCHFLRRGFTKPEKILFNCAVWSADSRWLVLGTQIGDLALWEAEALKVHKIISIPAHKEFYGDSEHVKAEIPITAIAWKHYGNLLVTGDNRGLIQYCDETFRNVFVAKEAHIQAVRGLSFAPFDSKLASCSDDGRINIWSIGYDRPDKVLLGHQSDIKCIDWHPFRSLIASGSRDSTLKMWDPRQALCVSTITAHKKQVNCCQWNVNGNWLASGSTDGLIKIFDLRMMKEMDTLRGQNSEVCRIAWHPLHESLLVSGGYNGSLVYWIMNQYQTPHSRIEDAHRQSIDLMAWHPSGHLLATASHDCILKFWCREPVGSKLEPLTTETAQENLPTYFYGPLQAQHDVEALIASRAAAANTNAIDASAMNSSLPSNPSGAARRSGGGGRKRSHQDI